MISKQYDYIIAGAGAAGLSLLVRMISSGKFREKNILLVDKDTKTTNDRTWCFWDNGTGLFNNIVYKHWKELSFHGESFSREFNVSPYQYNMIRGIDFYDHCLNLIRAQSNITIRFGHISAIESKDQRAFIVIDEETITAQYVFSSIIFKNPEPKKGEYYLLQHFKGWFIKTNIPVFNQHSATLMDFRTGQQNGTAFVYVMPFSSTTALVEYTLFSEALLPQAEYDNGLKDYLERVLNCSDYEVSNEEFGVIPMTNHRFPRHDGNVFYIGTAGGQTKASSGYTFQFIQKNAETIVLGLLKGAPLSLPDLPARFHFYDSVLLNVLSTGKLPGKFVFTELFRKNPAQRIFKFLDNESSLIEDIRLISTLPTLPFFKAAIQYLF